MQSLYGQSMCHVSGPMWTFLVVGETSKIAVEFMLVFLEYLTTQLDPKPLCVNSRTTKPSGGVMMGLRCVVSYAFLATATPKSDFSKPISTDLYSG